MSLFIVFIFLTLIYIALSYYSIYLLFKFRSIDTQSIIVIFLYLIFSIVLLIIGIKIVFL